MNWRDLSHLSLAQPAWLWLLLLAPLLAILRGRVGGAPAVLYSSTAIFQGIGRPRASRAGAFSGALLTAAFVASVLGMARPQLANSLTHVEASGIDIMIALDVSGSMLTEDYTIGRERTNRVNAIKEITQRFIEARPNDRIGMVAFAGRPYLISPPTLDHDWLISNLEDRVRVGLVEDGTAIGSALVSAANRLKNREAKSRIIVLLSDGENNAGRVDPGTAAEAVRVLGLKIYTIGVGTDSIAPYPVLDPRTRQPVLDPFTGRPRYEQIRGEFGEKTLSDVARIAGGHFFRAQSSEALLGIYTQIDKLEKSRVQIDKYRQYRDLFPWFAAAALGLITAQMTLSQTLWRRLP